MTDEPRPEENQSGANEPDVNEPAFIDAIETTLKDPIGDLGDGEASKSLDPQSSMSAEKEAEISAVEERSLGKPEAVDGTNASDEDGDPAAAADDEDDEVEFKSKSRPPAKLERLQKILAASGVASRRKAEEMIEQGRVQINGKVVTVLGTKADGGRDHIRVDGKLLQGAERLRYFVLNKPRGFVTTVSDPEGRPTVMQFFDKMRERLYPVGRLDYMSEGLLLVTNDGELANKLTRASAGVEKTYLVKVAGIPTEGELDVLRSGVAIEKGKPGSPKVRTSPAAVRQVRQGDNPWFEVVLIEGRNRELRKMFVAVGHFVEKIRRVGYGPLILDQEPGNLRELDAQELDLLRKAADGKLKTPKAKEIRRRNIIDSLPPEKPAFKPRGAKPAAGPKDYKPKRSFGTDTPVRSGMGTGRLAPAKFGSSEIQTRKTPPAARRIAPHGGRTIGLEAQWDARPRAFLQDRKEKSVRLPGGASAANPQPAKPTAQSHPQAAHSETGPQAETTLRGLAADPLATSPTPAATSRPSQAGRSPKASSGRTPNARSRPGLKQRGAPHLNRSRTLAPGSRRACTLSRCTNPSALTGPDPTGPDTTGRGHGRPGRTARASTARPQDVQNQAARNKSGRDSAGPDLAVPGPNVPAEAGPAPRAPAPTGPSAPKAVSPAHSPQAAASRAPAAPARAANRAKTQDALTAQDPSAGRAPVGSPSPGDSRNPDQRGLVQKGPAQGASQPARAGSAAARGQAANAQGESGPSFAGRSPPPACETRTADTHG